MRPMPAPRPAPVRRERENHRQSVGKTGGLGCFVRCKLGVTSHEPPGVRPSSGAAVSAVEAGLEFRFPRESSDVAAPEEGRTAVHVPDARPTLEVEAPYESGSGPGGPPVRTGTPSRDVCATAVVARAYPFRGPNRERLAPVASLPGDGSEAG